MWALRVLRPIKALVLFNHALKQSCRTRDGRTINLQQHREFSGKAFSRVGFETESRWRVQTLAIETSCDDTSVAVLAISGTKESRTLCTEVLFHDKITANSDGYGGIHPLVALDSHQTQLAHLVQEAVQFLEPNFKDRSNVRTSSPRPDFVSVTRGPGMRSNLSVGLNTAKGLALAWHVPLLGVHHMQAHALTSRLCSTIEFGEGVGQTLQRNVANENKSNILEWDPDQLEPRFPFLSLLVSGGHTMLIDSSSLTDHRILAESQDIAIGDYLDKSARAVVAPSELRTPFGKALEDFAFPPNRRYDYNAPRSRQDEIERQPTKFGWSLSPPLAESKGGEKSSRRMVYTFSGLLSSVQRLVHNYTNAERIPSYDSKQEAEESSSERRELAKEVQRVAFEHLGSRILLHLQSLDRKHAMDSNIETIVVSGGVASNKYLRHVLRSMLDARGYSSIKLQFPPPQLCTDNALMIAWAGMEMYDAGYESELSIQPLRKWSMDSSAEDGGVLGVGGWKEKEVG